MQQKQPWIGFLSCANWAADVEDVVSKFLSYLLEEYNLG